ncbi:TPA: hypothetical protein QCI36_003589 [Enterobacter ludwigii]|nr:hypothetical protein [Enterobacter ludwigii]
MILKQEHDYGSQGGGQGVVDKLEGATQKRKFWGHFWGQNRVWGVFWGEKIAAICRYSPDVIFSSN